MFSATFSDEANQRVYSSQPLIAGGDAALPLFLYIGRWSPIAHHSGWVQLYLFKHMDTRRYLAVAKDATCLRCTIEGYTAVARNEAIAHAFS